MAARKLPLATARMPKRVVIFIGIVLATGVASVTALLLGDRTLGRWLAAPSIILSGWAAFGHLITLDDDMPGEWSNPEGAYAKAAK